MKNYTKQWKSFPKLIFEYSELIKQFDNSSESNILNSDEVFLTPPVCLIFLFDIIRETEEIYFYLQMTWKLPKTQEKHQKDQTVRTNHNSSINKIRTQTEQNLIGLLYSK